MYTCALSNRVSTSAARGFGAPGRPRPAPALHPVD